MRKSIFFFFALLLLILSASNTTTAQQYKLRQSTNMMSMKTESTIYVKGMRKRTESAGMMGMSVPTTIEQCDLQRTIKLNDKKKLYFIEPFAKEDVIDDDAKPAASKAAPIAQPKTTTKTGGTINMWYNITDTGERKKMNGFTARHIWTTQKIKPSPDACMMKDSLIIKTDGWYIDLPEFNCPIRYTPSASPTTREKYQPDCKDKFVSHRSGKGKLGFPLIETRTIIMGGGKTNEFVTNLETVEFSSLKLDSMLFEIPPGYTETKNESDLQDKMDVQDMMNQYKTQAQNSINNSKPTTDEKKPGIIRIGVFKPTGGDQLQTSDIQQYLAGILISGNVEAVSVNSAEDAKNYNCDYTLSTDFTKIKQASKVGGILKAIKNSDPNAASSFNIDANLVLKNVADGSTRLQQSVTGKYDGKADDAAKKAMDEGSRLVLKGLK